MIDRNRHTIDLAGETLGRSATKIAMILMGKHKPTYEPRIDGGDFVRAINIDKVVFTGKKMEQKEYIHASNRPGGLRRTPLWRMWKTRPHQILRRAVMGMLPKNSHQMSMIKRLEIAD